MNEGQVNTILSMISQLKSIDIQNKFTEKYAEQDIQNLMIGDFSADELLTTLQRVIVQLEREIESVGKYLPISLNAGDIGNMNIQGLLQNTITNLNNSNFDPLSANLRQLVYYQIINGFWDKSDYKLHDAENINIVELKEKTDLISKHIEKQSEKVNQLFQQLQSEKSELSKFRNQKSSELQQISNNLEQSNKETTRISELLKGSTINNDKIGVVLEEQTNKMNEVERNINSLKKSSDELIAKLENQYSDFDEKLKFVDSKKEHFEKQNDYLDSLIGKQTSVSLFKSFGERKDEILKSIKFWRIVVFVMSGLSTMFIIGIFTNFFGWTGSLASTFSWETILINTLKSLPVFFLLYYSTNQYNKERNFHEEYAFKSAVALTVKSYADLIEDPETKDKQIFQSVENVYKSPIHSKPKKNEDASSIIDVVNNTFDTAKEIVIKKLI